MLKWRPSYFHVRTGACFDSLRVAFAECSEEERALSGEYLERYAEGGGVGNLTLLRGVRQGPGPLARHGELPRDGDPAQLADALVECVAEGGAMDVALSGGVDSWLLAILLRSRGYQVRGWYLETGVEGYCEAERVRWLSRELGISCRYIQVSTADFVRSLPEFTAAVEAPIYNLHPVSKWLLAWALRDEGVSRLVTGDGADQVLRQETDCDLLPLTLGCFGAAGVSLIAPFLSDRVARMCHRPDPDKRIVRALAERLGVPPLPKRPTLFPAIEPQWQGSGVTLLAHTADLLLASLEVPQTCAASPA